MFLIGEPVIVPVIVVWPFDRGRRGQDRRRLERGIARLGDASRGVVVDES